MLTLRPLAGDDDYWRIRDFLRTVMARNGDRELSWHVARLDYWWWFGNPDLEHLDPRDQVLLWETAGGELGAVVNPEGHAQAFLQVHPDHRTAGLLAEMVDAAREHLAEPGPDGSPSLTVWADAGDHDLQSVLGARGFRRVDRPGAAEWQHCRVLDPAPPPPPATPGYDVRPQRDGLELLERCYASGLAFHDDDIAVARANRDDPDWYRHIQAAPLYRRDLDIVAVAADGSIAAFCTAWFDDVTRTAYLEPVATVAAHRRRGLARAVILEALGRLHAMGCRTAFVGGYSTEANALYSGVMGGTYDVSEPWELAV
jgi:GNAT superfamily N-acetyltransferase